LFRAASAVSDDCTGSVVGLFAGASYVIALRVELQRMWGSDAAFGPDAALGSRWSIQRAAGRVVFEGCNVCV